MIAESSVAIFESSLEFSSGFVAGAAVAPVAAAEAVGPAFRTICVIKLLRVFYVFSRTRTAKNFELLIFLEELVVEVNLIFDTNFFKPINVHLTQKRGVFLVLKVNWQNFVYESLLIRNCKMGSFWVPRKDR